MRLVQGVSGPDVVKLQQRLRLKPDGYFGPLTKQAVKDWQKANKLEATGEVDQITWNKLFDNIVDVELVAAAQISTKLDLDKLIGVVPEEVLHQLRTVSQANTINRVAHFVSQCMYESNRFKNKEENLNYSSSRLKQMFPKYFPGTLSEEYAHKPEKIGSRVYANRMGNGSEETGEGYKYRGRGYIQLTGKNNYTALQKEIGEDCVTNPDIVASKYPLFAAVSFFSKNNIWPLCDQATEQDVRAVTRKINGGLDGLEDRLSLFSYVLARLHYPNKL